MSVRLAVEWETSVQIDNVRDVQQRDDGSVLVLGDGVTYLNAQGSVISRDLTFNGYYSKLYVNDNLVLAYRGKNIIALNIASGGSVEWAYTHESSVDRVVITDDGLLGVVSGLGVEVVRFSEL